ncbi:MAG: ATP-binding protein [Sphaerochaetaceae bacterium]
MNKFVSKALQKIDQLDTKQIESIINNLDNDEKMLEVTLDSMRDGVILAKQNNTVVFVNCKCSLMIPMFRPSLNGYEGMRLDKVIDDKHILSYICTCLTKGGEGLDNEFNFPWGDGFKTIAVQVVLSDRLKNSYVVMLCDVTEQNLAAAKLHQSENLASMTTMAASVAHEIKNPLAAMGIHLQLLKKAFQRKKNLTLDDAQRYIDVLDEEIDRLNGIVVDFLFAVRPMNTKLRLGYLDKIVRETADFVKPELEKNKVKIILDIRIAIPMIEFDENLVKQVLLNLIKNAMNAMEKGGTLTLSMKLDGNNVLLKVRDTGSGIPAENLSKIFEPYFTTKTSGTGLGLTVVYKVMKEHKGDVSVQSKVGEGTCFTLSFPVPENQRLTLPKGGINIDSTAVEVNQ